MRCLPPRLADDPPVCAPKKRTGPFWLPCGRLAPDTREAAQRLRGVLIAKSSLCEQWDFSLCAKVCASSSGVLCTRTALHPGLEKSPRPGTGACQEAEPGSRAMPRQERGPPHHSWREQGLQKGVRSPGQRLGPSEKMKSSHPIRGRGVGLKR